LKPKGSLRIWKVQHCQFLINCQKLKKQCILHFCVVILKNLKLICLHKNIRVGRFIENYYWLKRCYIVQRYFLRTKIYICQFLMHFPKSTTKLPSSITIVQNNASFIKGYPNLEHPCKKIFGRLQLNHFRLDVHEILALCVN